jgi:hypothetical protein
MIEVTANKLAEFIIARTPERRRAIVLQVRRSQKAHPNYYSCFHGPARRFFISGGRDQTEIARTISRLKNRHQNDWYARDSRLTTEAFQALLKLSPRVGGLNCSFVEPGRHSRTKLQFPEVHVSVTPNLIVHGERKGKPLIGALRFYIAKESASELGQRGAGIVSVLEYLWLTQLATGSRTPDKDLCMVLECFQQRITAVPPDADEMVPIIDQACRDFARLWHTLDDEKAA